MRTLFSLLFLATPVVAHADPTIGYGPFSIQDLPIYPSTYETYWYLETTSGSTPFGSTALDFAYMWRTTTPSVTPVAKSSSDFGWTAFCEVGADICMKNGEIDDTEDFWQGYTTSGYETWVVSTCTGQKPTTSTGSGKWKWLSNCEIVQHLSMANVNAGLAGYFIEVSARAGTISGWFWFPCPGGVCEDEPTAFAGSPSFTYDPDNFHGTFSFYAGYYGYGDVTELEAVYP